MGTTKGKPSGTLRIKPTINNINLLIELTEQADKPAELAKAEVRMAVRIAKMLDLGGIIYTTEFSPNELELPETVKPPKSAKPKFRTDPPADKPHPPKPE